MPARPAPVITHQLGWLKGVQFAGGFLAEANGHLAALGVRAEFLPGGPTTDYRGVVARGQALVSETTPLGLVDAALAGQPLVALAAVMQRDPAALISRADAPIASLADLAGRTIAAPPGVRRLLEGLLRRSGVAPEQVEFLPPADDPARLAARRIDGWYAHATLGVPAMQASRVEPHALHLADLGAPGYAQMLIARRDRLEAHRDLLVRHLRALVRGWRDFLQDPDAAARRIVDNWARGSSLDAQRAQAALTPSYISSGDALTHGLLWIAPERIAAALDFAGEVGLAPRAAAVDAAGLVDQSLITEALS